MNKFKELFDYNADVARFIGRHGTIDSKGERKHVSQAQPHYLRLQETNKGIGSLIKEQMKKALKGHCSEDSVKTTRNSIQQSRSVALLNS